MQRSALLGSRVKEHRGCEMSPELDTLLSVGGKVLNFFFLVVSKIQFLTSSFNL